MGQQANKKLSKTQQEVLHMMRNGWELGTSSGLHGRSWLQRGGLGRGGEVKRVSYATVYSLFKAGLIKHHYGFPTSRYTIATEQEAAND